MKQNKDIKYENRFTKLEEGYKFLCDEVSDIKLQVSNHIPTQLKELGEDLALIRLDINKRPSWLISMAVSSLIGIAMFLLGLLLNS